MFDRHVPLTQHYDYLCYNCAAELGDMLSDRVIYFNYKGDIKGVHHFKSLYSAKRS